MNPQTEARLEEGEEVTLIFLHTSRLAFWGIVLVQTTSVMEDSFRFFRALPVNN